MAVDSLDLRSVPKRRFYSHSNLHGQMIQCATVPCTLQRNCIARVLYGRHADEIVTSHSARRRLYGDNLHRESNDAPIRL
jgi:hypothetical protein